MSSQDLPTCVSLLICDSVVEDIRTHKKSFLNAFNTIWSLKLPALHTRMFVAASVTNLRKQAEVTLSIQAPNGKSLVEVSGTLPARGISDVYDLVFELEGLPLSEFGMHVIMISADKKVIGQRTFSVRLPESK